MQQKRNDTAEKAVKTVKKAAAKKTAAKTTKKADLKTESSFSSQVRVIQRKRIPLESQRCNGQRIEE